jgi:ATP/maltotriose-dependent transcriptional regulator MalT
VKARTDTTEARVPKPPPPLLITKLHPPPAREQTVARDRLVQRLQPRPGIKLTVVAAPAGSGKTTLLGIWRDAELARRPVAWVTLDEGDNEAVVLWSHVLEALRRVCPDLTVTPSPAAVGAAHVVDLVLPRLVNELAEQEGVALILDDFHRLSSGPARDSLAWFIEHAPSSLQLLLATRSEPALPLGALRAHGELLELRARDLWFTSDEADDLLNGHFGLGLARADVDRLVERTEGWPAGLYLAALSLRAVDDREAFLTRFGGQNRHVVDFLLDDVLDAHDAAAQSLMLRSSVLGRLTGPLCDFVLEREGSAELLGELSCTNLFLLPLDDEGECYRFHQLFAQLLRVELEHREPGLAPSLHRRASAWHRDHGSVAEAIEHAFEAGAFDEAAELVSGAWLSLMVNGRLPTILGWLDRFPPELVRDDRRLLLAQSWLRAFCGEREEAAAALAALERKGWPGDGPLPDGFSSLEASLATIRATFPGGDVGEGYRNALRAAELETPQSAPWSAASRSLGLSRYFQGDLDGADRAFAAAAKAGARNQRWLTTASALAYRSLIAGERDRLDLQRVLAEQALALAEERGIGELSGEVYVANGEALAAGGELDEALPAVARGVAIARSLGRPLEAVDALTRFAALCTRMSQRVAAAAAIAEAATILDGCADPGILRERLGALERPSRTNGRRDDAVLSERELVVLRMLIGRLSEREIGRELYLSHNTVHSHTKSIYRKLGVSSRSDAVRKARELGLLSRLAHR